LDDGREVSYDRLLIATGATQCGLTVPGSELPGVHYLRTLEDAKPAHVIGKIQTEGRRTRWTRSRRGDWRWPSRRGI